MTTCRFLLKSPMIDGVSAIERMLRQDLRIENWLGIRRRGNALIDRVPRGKRVVDKQLTTRQKKKKTNAQPPVDCVAASAASCRRSFGEKRGPAEKSAIKERIAFGNPLSDARRCSPPADALSPTAPSSATCRRAVIHNRAIRPLAPCRKRAPRTVRRTQVPT